MGLRIVGAVLATLLLANSGAGTGGIPARSPDARATKDPGSDRARSHGASQDAVSSPSQRALTVNYPEDPSQPQWIESSNPDEDDDTLAPNIYRLRGDRFSKYYYVERGLRDNDIRTEDGHLLAHTDRYADNMGARKTPSRLSIIFYYEPRTRLPSYDIAVIERARARLYRCAIDQPTLEAAAGEHFQTRAKLIEAQYKFSNLMLNMLQDAEPALQRDHCRMIDNGVRAAGSAAVKPTLRLRFPRIGDVLTLDQRGFKGGWLYGGGMSYSTVPKDCCAYQFSGDGVVAYIIAKPVPAGRRNDSARLRVLNIVYVKPNVRRSYDCKINGRRVIDAEADANWKNGTAYLTYGQDLQIVHWGDTPPDGCSS